MKTHHTCDFRSDTVTTPTQEMRDAMRTAAVGDDVFNDDPTVHELQRIVAELFGKEDALFFPSGTMGNICATMTHCSQRGQEVICGDMSHIFLNEQGGVCSLGGLGISTAPNQNDGSILLSDLERCVRPADNVCTPRTGLICVENTHNFKGGLVLERDYMDDIGKFCRSHKVPLHLDGARILHASTYLGCSVDQLTRDADSVMMCISKGLGAPVGSLVAGTKDFCKQARRIRKVLGGGLRQAGILAAAGIVALNTTAKWLHKAHFGRQIVPGKEFVSNICGVIEQYLYLTENNNQEYDHEKNFDFAQRLAAYDNDIFSIDLDKCQTNMTILNMKNAYNPAVFCDQLETIFPDEAHDLGEEIQVRLFPITRNAVRATFHIDNTFEDVSAALSKIKYVVEHHCKIGEKENLYTSSSTINSYF